MKILIITRRFTTNRDIIKDDFGRQVRMAEVLSKAGNEITMFCIDYKRLESFECTLHNFDVIVRPFSLNSFLKLYVELYILARKNKYDFIIGASHPLCGALAYTLHLFFKSINVYEIQDNYDAYLNTTYSTLNKVLTLINHFLIRHSINICASDLLKTESKLRGGKSLFVMPNGVDTNLFKEMDRNFCRKIFDLPSNKKVVLYAGSFGVHSGLDLLMQSFMMVKEKIPDSILILAGTGPYESTLNDYKKKIGNDLRILNIKPNCVPLILNVADCLVMPYPKNDFTNYCDNPLKLMEYMSVNKPIVSTDFGNVSDILCETDIIKENTPHMMANLIVSKLNGDSNCNYATIVKRHTWDKIGMELHRFLLKIYTEKS